MSLDARLVHSLEGPSRRIGNPLYVRILSAPGQARDSTQTVEGCCKIRNTRNTRATGSGRRFLFAEGPMHSRVRMWARRVLCRDRISSGGNPDWQTAAPRRRLTPEEVHRGKPTIRLEPIVTASCSSLP